MKRFLLFAFDHYYPGGGLLDVQESYDTLEEAIEGSLEFTTADEMYVLDREQWKFVHGASPVTYNPKTREYESMIL